MVDGGMQNNTHTVVEFRRNLETCDPNDIQITVSFSFLMSKFTMKLIFFRKLKKRLLVIMRMK